MKRFFFIKFLLYHFDELIGRGASYIFFDWANHEKQLMSQTVSQATIIPFGSRHSFIHRNGHMFGMNVSAAFPTRYHRHSRNSLEE